ncbi:alpha/beta hydrolase family protein [Sphingomonas sp. MS122]|uniref:alpha/beta hydrolase family protein n=1 Tax=Sphingomonas sp. MS122 TaxID=3412683 RepID=UPI003C30BAAD
MTSSLKRRQAGVGLWLRLATAIAVHLFSCGAFAWQAALPPSAAAFGEPPFIRDPLLSPDGTKAVAYAFDGKRHAVMLIHVEDDTFETELIAIGKHAPNWIRWAGNDRLLMGTPGLGYLMSGIGSLDLTTRKFTKLAAPTWGVLPDNVIHVAQDGSFALLDGIARNTLETYVWRIDLASGKFTRIVDAHSNIHDYYADDEGVVRAGIGLVGKTYHSIYRDADGGYRRIKRARIDVDENSTIDKIFPRPGSTSAYAVANPGSGRFGLYHYDLTAGELGARIFEHPEVDIEDIERRRGGEVLGIRYTDDRSRVHWLDPALDKLQKRIDVQFPGRVNNVVSLSADEQTAIIWSTAPEDPGAFYLYRAAHRRFIELARPYDKLIGIQLAPTRYVSYAARDGLRIPAYLTVPVGRPARALPLIVMPHGGPFVRDSWAYDPYVQFLASRGYAVLQPNFRGSTGYGRDFARAGEGEWGRKMQDDVDDGARWLAAEGVSDPKRVCIMGASYGGYAAMWASIRSPDIYRCAISLAGISDVKAMLRYDRSKMLARRYYRDWRDRVRGEEDFDVDAISPIRMANLIGMPILIGHGGQDTNVPPDQSEKFHAALIKGGKTSELVLYPESAHGTTNAKDTTDFLSRVERFLAKHNPADL